MSGRRNGRNMPLSDLDPDGCPECAGIDVVGDSWDLDGIHVSQRVECSDCGAKWNDIYVLTIRMVDKEGGDFDTTTFTRP